MRISVGFNNSTGSPDLQEVYRYLGSVRDVMKDHLGIEVVGTIAAESRKAFYKSSLNGTYHWARNPSGQIEYGTKGAGRPAWQRRAWSQEVVMDNSGWRGKANRRMVSFGLSGKGTVKTARFASFPMNPWEEDVTYRPGKHWGPWGRGGKNRTRKGIHSLQKFAPQITSIIPGAIEKAIAHEEESLEKKEGR